MSTTTAPDAQLDRRSRPAAEVDRIPERGGRLWQCACGQGYRVWGCDRHRIYWPLERPLGEPVMDGCCASCRRPLPGKQPHCQASPGR